MRYPLIFMLFFTLVACNRDKIEPINLNCPDTVTYEADVQFIINTKCATEPACHAAGSTLGEYETYEGMTAHINSGKIKTRVIDFQNMPPSGSDPLTEDELLLIQCWAQDDYPKN